MQTGRLSFYHNRGQTRVRVVIEFVKKNTWVVLVAAFLVLVVAGILMS